MKRFVGILAFVVSINSCVTCYAYINNLKSNHSIGVTPHVQKVYIDYTGDDDEFTPSSKERLIWNIDPNEKIDPVKIPYEEYNQYILNTMCHYLEQMTNKDVWSPIAFISAYNEITDNPHNDSRMKLNYPVYMRECGWYNIKPEELDFELQKRWMLNFNYFNWKHASPTKGNTSQRELDNKIEKLKNDLSKALHESKSSIEICSLFKQLQDTYLKSCKLEATTQEEAAEVMLDYHLRRCLTDNILLFADHPIPNARMNPISLVEYSKRKDYTYTHSPSWDYAGEMDKWVLSDHFNCIVGELDINLGSSNRLFVDENNIKNDSSHEMSLLTDEVEIAKLTYEYTIALGEYVSEPDEEYLKLVQKYKDELVEQLDLYYEDEVKWEDGMLDYLLDWLERTNVIPRGDRRKIVNHPNELKFMARVWIDSRNIEVGGTR